MLFDLVSGPRWQQDLAVFAEKAFTPELDSRLGNIAYQPSLRYTSSYRCQPSLGYEP